MDKVRELYYDYVDWMIGSVHRVKIQTMARIGRQTSFIFLYRVLFSLAFGTLFLMVLCAVAAPPLVAQERTPSWFSPTNVINEKWLLIYNIADPLRFELIQKDAPNTDTPYKIMLAFPKRSSAYDTAVERITEQFIARGIPVNFTAVNFQSDQQKGISLLREIESGEYDLVFSVGSTSTKFITENIQYINTPVVSVTSKDPLLLGHVTDYNSGSGTNIAYTSLDVPVEVQLAYLRELRPELMNIGVMYARNNLSAYEAQVVPLRDAVADSVNIIDIVVEDQDNAATELAQKIPQAIEEMRITDPYFANSIFWITGSTSVFQEIETINAHSNAIPVVSLVTDVVQEGKNSAVISIGIGFDTNADLASFYAMDILLNGIDPATLPVGVVNPPDIAINFLVAKSINMQIPFNFFESSATIYDSNGILTHKSGEQVFTTLP